MALIPVGKPDITARIGESGKTVTTTVEDGDVVEIPAPKVNVNVDGSSNINETIIDDYSTNINPQFSPSIYVNGNWAGSTNVSGDGNIHIDAEVGFDTQEQIIQELDAYANADRSYEAEIDLQLPFDIKKIEYSLFWDTYSGGLDYSQITVELDGYDNLTHQGTRSVSKTWEVGENVTQEKLNSITGVSSFAVSSTGGGDPRVDYGYVKIHAAVPFGTQINSVDV